MWYGLAIGTVWYSRYLDVVTETSYPLNSISPLLTISPGQTPFCSVSMSLTILASSYNRNHAGIVLLWIISFGIISPWLIYAVVFDRISFFWSNSILLYICVTFSLSIHPFDDHECGFHLLALVNNAALNMGVHIPLGDSDFNSFADISRSGLLDVSSILFWKEFPVFFWKISVDLLEKSQGFAKFILINSFI